MPPEHGRRLAEPLAHTRLVEIPDSHTLIPLDSVRCLGGPSFDPTRGSDRLFGVQAFAADELAEQVRVVTLDHLRAVAHLVGDLKRVPAGWTRRLAKLWRRAYGVAPPTSAAQASGSNWRARQLW